MRDKESEGKERQVKSRHEILWNDMAWYGKGKESEGKERQVKARQVKESEGM
jgi:hypothetical protein